MALHVSSVGIRWLSVLGAALVVACTASAPYEPVRAPPAGVQYPRRLHQGHVFYWVGGRWYVRSGDQWYAYPPPLPPSDQYFWRGSAW